MCIPGDHGAPFLVSSIQRSYSASDSVPRLQTASVPVCHCAPCSQHVPFEPQTVATRAFHLEVSLPACRTLSASASWGSENSLISSAPVRPKFVHLLLALLFFLCWRLTCVNSDSVIYTMTNSNYTRQSDDQIMSSSRKLSWNFPAISNIPDQVETVKKPVTTFPLKRATRVSVLHKRMLKRESSKGYGPTDVGAGTFTSSITIATQLLNPALIHFICSRLPDPCARAAYLREHVRHELCLDIPFLYVLPNTTISQNSRTTTGHPNSLYDTQSGTCRESGAHSLNYIKSDSLFEMFLSSSNICVRSLTEANQQIRDRLEPMFREFDRLLEKSYCKKQSDPDLNVTGEFQCEECRDAYRSWLCTTVIQPVFPLRVWPLEELQKSITGVSYLADPLPSAKFPVPGDTHRERTNLSSSNSPDLVQSAWSANRQSKLTESRDPWIGHSRGLRQQSVDNSYTSAQRYRLVDVEPCVSWCTRVETLCPYFNPADPTANGGEPAFLCDEGHYHHSSRYQVIYRSDQLCEAECCYSRADMESLSHVSVPVATDSLAESVYSAKQSTTKAGSESGPGQGPSWTVPLDVCEPLELRCKHHGYSAATRPVLSPEFTNPPETLRNPGREQLPSLLQQLNPSVTSKKSESVASIVNRPSASSSVHCTRCPSIRILGVCLLSVLCYHSFCGYTCFYSLIFRYFMWLCMHPICYSIQSVYSHTHLSKSDRNIKSGSLRA